MVLDEVAIVLLTRCWVRCHVDRTAATDLELAFAVAAERTRHVLWRGMSSLWRGVLRRAPAGAARLWTWCL